MSAFLSNVEASAWFWLIPVVLFLLGMMLWLAWKRSR